MEGRKKMSSNKPKSGGLKKPLALVDIYQLLPENARQHSTASTASSEPVVDGITTTSGMELPFSLDDPKHDPIFHTSPSKYATDNGAASLQQPAAKAPLESSSSIGNHGAGEQNSNAAPEQNLSDDETETESDDSSIDIPIEKKRPAVARRRTIEQSKVQQQFRQQLPEQKESATASATNEKTTMAAAPEQNTSAQAQAKRKASTTLSATLHPNNSPSGNETNGSLRSSPLEGPPRKRARTEAVDSGTESNNENVPPNQLPTPPLGDHPRPRLNEEEQRLFDKIDRMILDDEWAELKEKIDGQILAAEEEDLLSRIDQSIRAAEAASKPGGKVIYQAQVLEDGSLEEEYPPVTEDPLLVDEESPPPKSLVETEEERSSERVFDVEDFSGEVFHKARLPKYARNAQERLVTQQVLEEKVVGPIMTEESKFVRPGKLAVRLDDSPDDPHSVLLHCQGHPHLVERAETQVAELIRAEQRRLRLVDQEAREKTDSSSRREPSGKPSPQEMQRRKDLAADKQKKYQEFVNTYQGVIAIIMDEVHGVHHQKVKSCMWDCHKQKYGTVCGDDCDCPSDLPYLASTVISSYIDSQIKKNPNWDNHIRKKIGFVDYFTKRFYPLLEKEYPNETPKQLLARLVHMWGRHTRELRFGRTCSKNCPCREGWEKVFKRGRLHPNEILKDEESAKRTVSNQTVARIPRRRPSNEGSYEGLLALASGSAAEAREKEASQSAAPGRIPRRQSSSRDLTDATPGQLVSALPSQSFLAKPASIPRRQLAATSGAASVPVPKKSAAIARKAGAASQAPQNRSYEIVFQPGEPMGFFCVNETEKGSPACKLVSVYDSTAMKHPQVRFGTVVTDVTHEGGHVQPVRTYSDLNQHYKKAKKNGTPITVRFVNPDNSSSLLGNLAGPDSRAVYGEWTPTGEWIGSTQGWAGGARCITGKDLRAQQATAQTPRGGSQAEVGHRSSVQGQSGGMTLAQVNRPSAHVLLPQPPKPVPLQYSSTMAPAKHRELKPSKSILRKPTDWSKKQKKPSVSDAKSGDSVFKTMAGTGPRKKIKFSDKREKRFYEPKSKSFRMAPEVSSSPSSVSIDASTDASRAVEAAPTSPGTKELIDAIKNKDFREVIAVLQACASPSGTDCVSHKTPKEVVKERLEELKSELGKDPSNQKIVAQKRDFELKRKVLSIYLDAISTIDKARFNRNWERVNVKVDRIKNVCLSVRGAEHGGSQVLQCRARLKGEQMPPSPLIPIDGTIMGDWRSDPASSGYAYNYNHGLAKKHDSGDPSRKQLVLSLYKGDTNDAVPQLLLSKANIELSRISTKAMEKEKIEETLDPSEYIASCSIELTPSVAKDDEETRLRTEKAAEAVSKLKDVIEWINKFNKEKGVNVGALSGQITEPETGISLLHAAIYLDEPDLVSQLVRLGANPEAPSHVGSARLLAHNLYAELARKDEKDAKARGERDEKNAKARKLLSILNSNGDRDQSLTVDTNLAASPDEESITDISPTSPSVDTNLAVPPEGAPTTTAISEAGRNPAAAHPEQERQGTSPPPLALSTSSSPGSEDSVARLPAYAALADSGGSDSRELVKHTATASPQNSAHMTPYSSLADGASSNRAPPTVSNRSPPKAAGYTLPVSPPSDVARVDVPAFDFWRFPDEERCRFFGKEGTRGCHRGPQCRYMHVSRPVGSALDGEQLQDDVPLNSDRVVKKTMRNEEGRLFHTAAFRDPRDNVWYVAEGGPFIGKSKNVSWYNTEEEAMHALKRVVAFHRRSQHSMYGHQQPQCSDDNHGEHGIYGPQPSRPKRPHDEHMDSRVDSRQGNKRARRGSTDDISPRSGHDSLFSRLLRQPNLALVHSQMFGKGLRRDDWTIRSDNQGRFTAMFASPLDRSKRYYSTQKGGGVYHDGSWWFKDEKSAKASAFYSLLEHCQKYGTVNADVTMTKDGRRLSL